MGSGLGNAHLRGQIRWWNRCIAVEKFMIFSVSGQQPPRFIVGEICLWCAIMSDINPLWHKWDYLWSLPQVWHPFRMLDAEACFPVVSPLGLNHRLQDAIPPGWRSFALVFPQQNDVRQDQHFLIPKGWKVVSGVRECACVRYRGIRSLNEIRAPLQGANDVWVVSLSRVIFS